MRCAKCGGKCQKLRVMDPDPDSQAERVAKTLMGVVSERNVAYQCKDCENIQILRIRNIKAMKTRRE